MTILKTAARETSDPPYIIYIYYINTNEIPRELSRENLISSWIIERLDRKIMSLGLISNRRLVGSCFKMALNGSIIVEICDETMAKMWRKPVEM